MSDRLRAIGSARATEDRSAERDRVAARSLERSDGILPRPGGRRQTDGLDLHPETREAMKLVLSS
jgi:hypothetical protein